MRRISPQYCLLSTKLKDKEVICSQKRIKMSGSSIESRSCCIICENECDGQLKIDEIEELMVITSLREKSNKNVQPSDVICPLCVDSIESSKEMPQQCENTAEKMKSSTSQESCQSPEKPDQPSSLWNTIIVNQIPMKIERDDLISLFSPYGAIEDTYLCEKVDEVGSNPHKLERIAQIRFSNEEEAWKVLEASQMKLIKYDDHVLMITVASDDFSPIQNLPNECLLEIFLRISSVSDKFAVERVCKRWNAISRQSWSSVTKVSDYWPSPTWRTIASRAGHSLRDIKIPMELSRDIRADFKDFKKSLSSIEKHCVRLERFMAPIVDSLNEKFQFPRAVFWKLYIPLLRSIISKNQCLKRLSLRWIDFDEDLINSFPPDLEEIHLSAYDYYGLPAPVELSRFQNLQGLILRDVFIGEDQLKGIETLENMKVLNFYDARVHPSNIDKIVDFTKLEYLAIPYCQISNVTLSSILRNNTGLKQLDISGIIGIGNSSWQYLSKLQYLAVLLMETVSFHSEAKNMDFTGMPALHTLNCNGCFSITDETIERLLSPTSTSMISRLYINHCCVTLKCLKTAKEWVSRTGQSLTIFVGRKIFKQWEGSRLGESCSNSSNITGGLRVAMYKGTEYCRPPQNDWDNYNLVIFND